VDILLSDQTNQYWYHCFLVQVDRFKILENNFSKRTLGANHVLLSSLSQVSFGKRYLHKNNYWTIRKF